jgi:Cof subfamily protein (haloacid dehalogenase superfamily)
LRSPQDARPWSSAPPALVAVDLDGTVLGPGTALAPAGAAALRRAAERGVVVVLATGRMLSSARGVQSRLGLGGPLVAYNGGLVALPDGGGWSDPVPLPAARAVAAACRDRGYFLQAYFADRLCVPSADPRAEAYARLAGVSYAVDPQAVWELPEAPTKLLVIEPAERMPEVRGALGPVAAGRCELAHSYPHYLEISAAGVDKGAALCRLAALLGLPRERVLAIGDGENDVPMLRCAGLGVAVANAAPAAAASAAFVTAAPYGDGVAEALAALLP